MARDKEEVSRDYTDRMRAEHAHKRVKDEDRLAIVGGSNRTTNIGAEIAQTLRQQMNVSELRDIDLSIADYVDRVDMNNADVLVLSQGYIHMDWLEKVPSHQVSAIVHNNLLSVIYCIQKFVKVTIDDPWRKYIVVIGSIAHRNILNGSAAYGAAKAGVNQYVRDAAWELAPKGYSVFALNPGNVDGTPMTDKVKAHLQRYRDMTPEEADAYWNAVKPVDRFLVPDDIAKVVRWLVGGEADRLSGTCLDMNGGIR